MQQQQQQQFQLQFQQQFLPQQHGGVGVAGGQLQPQYLPYMQMGGMSMSGGQQRKCKIENENFGRFERARGTQIQMDLDLVATHQRSFPLSLASALPRSRSLALDGVSLFHPFSFFMKAR